MIEAFGLIFLNAWWLAGAAIAALLLTLYAGKRLRYAPLRGLRRWAAHAGVFLALMSLAVLLCGTREREPVTRKAILLLIDVSGSVGGEIPERARRAYLELRATLDDDVLLGVAAYDGGVYPILEALPKIKQPARLEVSRISGANPLQSSFERAMDFAPMLLPQDCSAQVLVVSDGQGASKLSLLPLVTSILPIKAATIPDAGVAALHARSFPSVQPGMRGLAIECVVSATSAMDGELVILLDDQEILSDEVYLSRGMQALSRSIEATPISATKLEVRVRAVDDELAGNESMSINLPRKTVNTRVLVIDGSLKQGRANPGAAKALKAALEQSEFDVTLVSPGVFNADVSLLEEYDALLMTETYASDMPERVQRRVDAWVLAGGGLGMIGDPDGFALGGWQNTVIEDVLPIYCSARSDPDASVLLAIVVDISGSMGAPSGGGTKLDSALQGAQSAMRMLQEDDRFALLAFDSGPEWRVRIERIDDEAIEEASELIRSTELGGGGIDIGPALDTLYSFVLSTPATAKNVLVFTDAGDTVQPNGCVEMVKERFASEGVKLSVIGLGDESDRDAALIRELAEAGRGRAIFTNDAQSLPILFARESAQLIGGFVIEEALLPQVTVNTPLIDGIPFESAPVLRGMIRTSAKADAQVHLEAGNEEPMPLLATRRHGLGRSLAFTSDARDRWADNWLSWEGYPLSWQRWARWLASGEQSAGSVDASVEHSERGISVDIAHDAFADGQVKGVMLSSDGDGRRIDLSRNGSARSSAEIAMEEGGAFHLTFWFEPAAGGVPISIGELWISRPLLSEALQSDEDFFAAQKLARESGGLVIENAQESLAAFPRTLPRLKRSTLQGAMLGVFALFLLLSSRKFPTWGKESSGDSVEQEADAVSALALVRQGKSKRSQRERKEEPRFDRDESGELLEEGESIAAALSPGKAKGEREYRMLDKRAKSDDERSAVQRLMEAKRRGLGDGE